MKTLQTFIFCGVAAVILGAFDVWGAFSCTTRLEVIIGRM